ncbi:MAG TPA: histidine kinase dimerization/phospho-acceptor domain-containing protein, partial [Pyrinomonadaceae bacterium]
KDEFLAAVSHELRTPLTTIKALTRVLLRKNPTEEERREYLADIASECERQIDLVHNLLDLSRINAGGVQIELRRVSAEDVVRACEKIERVEAAEHGHELRVEVAPDLPPIRADHSALRRALCTVVGNAIRYTPDGGSIALRAESDGGTVAFEVEDNGRGIHPADLPHIFESFYRGRAAATSQRARTSRKCPASASASIWRAYSSRGWAARSKRGAVRAWGAPLRCASLSGATKRRALTAKRSRASRAAPHWMRRARRRRERG